MIEENALTKHVTAGFAWSWFCPI